MPSTLVLFVFRRFNFLPPGHNRIAGMSHDMALGVPQVNNQESPCKSCNVFYALAQEVTPSFTLTISYILRECMITRR